MHKKLFVYLLECDTKQAFVNQLRKSMETQEDQSNHRYCPFSCGQQPETDYWNHVLNCKKLVKMVQNSKKLWCNVLNKENVQISTKDNAEIVRPSTKIHMHFCSHCDEAFESEGLLPTEMDCPWCLKSSNSMESLIKYVKKFEKPDNDPMCIFCGQTFEDQQKHFWIHIKSCSHIKDHFKLSKESNETEVTDIVEDIDENADQNEKSKRQSDGTLSSEVKTETHLHFCYYCDEDFESDGLLPEEIDCPWCSKTLNSKESLLKYVEKFGSVENPICVFCGKPFASQTDKFWSHLKNCNDITKHFKSYEENFTDDDVSPSEFQIIEMKFEELESDKHNVSDNKFETVENDESIKKVAYFPKTNSDDIVIGITDLEPNQSEKAEKSDSTTKIAEGSDILQQAIFEIDVEGENVFEIMDVSGNVNQQDLTGKFWNDPEKIQDHNYSVLSKKETIENEFKECNVCKCKFPSETISNHLKSCAFNSLQKAKQALKLSATEKVPHIESFLHEELREGNEIE